VRAISEGSSRSADQSKLASALQPLLVGLVRHLPAVWSYDRMNDCRPG
jgi:hypothetical protein